MNSAPSLLADQRALLAWARSRRASHPAPAAFALPGVETQAHAEARLRTVREMLWLRQADALAATFPRTKAALGDAHFRALAADFIERCPTAHADLERAGGGLPTFLDENIDARARACAGLARVEWAVCLSFGAADPRSAPVEDAPSCALALAPASRLVAVAAHEAQAVLGAFPSCAASRSPGAPAAADDVVLIHRQSVRVRVRAVDADERECLVLASEEARFDAVCARFAHDPAALARTLLPLLRRGVLVLRRET